MSSATLERLLARIEDARHHYGPGQAEAVEKLLARTAGVRLPDARSLIRFHDDLLFLRAFPHSPGVVRLAEELLRTVCARVDDLRVAGADLSPLDDESVAGIAGTDIIETFSYEIAAWLSRNYQLEIYWDGDINAARLANTWPRFMPLLDEDGFVEPDVSYRDWLRAAAGGQDELKWLLARFATRAAPERQKAELFESLQLPVRWDLRDLPVTRTLARRPPPTLFYHDAPLLRRGDVDLAEELVTPVRLNPLSKSESARILDMARAALTVRYRSLYGMTFGVPPVYQADVGRGLQIFVWGLPPDRRHPLRTYSCGFCLKNGVPVNYLEAIALFDWVEVGFNVFYAFREGETAWIYAHILRALRALLGVSCISIYPYQIGADNEEAIKSGAFWFYRKLGFRPGRPDLADLVEKEEKKIAARPAYRTPARTLRRLAEGHMFFEVQGAPRGDWDRFHTRALGYAVNRHMAQNFDGDAQRFRHDSADALARALGVSADTFHDSERQALENFAMVLALTPDWQRWGKDERLLLLDIIRAKAAPEEWNYLRLLRRHRSLRDLIIRLGSN